MGDRIEFQQERWIVPDRPIIPFIEGDGTGPDIWRAARRVFDAVIEKVSEGRRRVEWLDVVAGVERFDATRHGVARAPVDAAIEHLGPVEGAVNTPGAGGKPVPPTEQ